MLTKYQKIHNMLDLEDISDIESKLLYRDGPNLELKIKDDPTTIHMLRNIFMIRPLYISAGSYGEPSYNTLLPEPYNSFLDTIMSIKSKNEHIYGGPCSLFRLNVYTVKPVTDNLYHQFFTLRVNDYVDESYIVSSDGK